MDTDTTPPFSLTLRRIALIFMSLVVSVIMGSALVASWNEPQVASRLELYQTDLLLQANRWEGEGLPAEQVAFLRENLLGKDPLKEAQKTYESVRETAAVTLEDQNLEELQTSPRLQNALAGQAELLNLLDLRLGILQAEQGDIPRAVEAWTAVKDRQANGSLLWQTADVLSALWQDRPIAADDDILLSQVLDGWFRYRALTKVYERSQETEKLAQLNQAAAQKAERTLLTVAAVGGLPVLGALAGTLIIILVGVQRLLKGSDALLARNRQEGWSTPWTAEAIGLVLAGGFFFIGQLVVPVVTSPFRSSLAAWGIRGQALYALTYYCLMAVGTIAVLLFTIRSYRPLPKDDEWFQFKIADGWLLWGIGGYLAALPLMLAVSVVNQQIWQGQGGSNPLLQTVLEANDPVALSLFFATAAIAAPLFEEFLFRGFLLPSLTRYMSVSRAIVLSSFIFALAHLSLSEVLPLMVLGMILGVVYTRSRNLLAPMLLHSAWNSVTMLGLFLLGSSVN